MKSTIALAFAGLAGVLLIQQAEANDRRYHDQDGYYQSTSPRAIRERQKHKHTFDETQYYERLSEEIPFGTAAWWRQKQFENTPR